MFKKVVLGCLLCSGISAVFATDDRAALRLAGTVDLDAPVQQAAIPTPGDRLVFKLYHPGPDGLEMDLKYIIVDQFELPLDFQIGPAIEMSGDTKHQRYVIEVYTDKDQDVLTLNNDELRASSGEALPLGTRGLTLLLGLH